MLYENLVNEVAVANQSEAMEADTISKNGRSSNRKMNSKIRYLFSKFFGIIVLYSVMGSFSGCDMKEKEENVTITISGSPKALTKLTASTSTSSSDFSGDYEWHIATQSGAIVLKSSFKDYYSGANNNEFTIPNTGDAIGYNIATRRYHKTKGWVHSNAIGPIQQAD